MTTELLLREAFEADDGAGFEPAPVDLIRRKASNRRRRNRGALAAAVLALIVGVGLVVGPTQTPETSDVFVSDETGTDETADTDEAEDEASTVTDLAGLGDPSTMVPIEDPFFDGRRPNVRTVVGDGAGGFVGMFFLSALDERGPTTIVSRSADGSDWDAVARWELGARVVNEVRRIGDEWMAVLQGPTTGYVGPYEPWDPRVSQLELAFTSDFETWTHREVSLDFSTRVSGAQASLEDVSVQPIVLGGGRYGDATAVQVAWFFDVSWKLTNEACGSGRDERGVFLIRCDGSIDVVLDGETFEVFGVAEPEWYLAEGDGPLALIGAAPAAPVRVTPHGFVAMNDSMDAVQRSADGRTWETIAELDDPEPGNWRWSLMSDDAGVGGSNVMLVGGALESDQVWLAKVDAQSGDVAMTPFPLDIDLTMTDGMIDHGPAGWSAVVTVRSTSARGITRDDLSVVRWPDGAISDAPFVVAPPVAGPSEGYRIGPSSDLIEMGLFGELRIRKPGSDEMLFDDVSWRDLENPSGLRSASLPVDGFAIDGWTITGDLVNGPLVIASPDGTEETFADGFAFTNGDFSDGVELIGARADEAGDGGLAYFVDGETVWTVEVADLYESAGRASNPAAGADPEGEPGDAWILRSDDGVSWEVAWAEEATDFGEFPQIIVGDDEVVVRRFSYPDALHTVALDE